MRFYKLLMDDSDDRDVVAYGIDTKGFEQYEYRKVSIFIIGIAKSPFTLTLKKEKD
jgi:hypothetical protein